MEKINKGKYLENTKLLTPTVEVQGNEQMSYCICSFQVAIELQSLKHDVLFPTDGGNVTFF